jgi:hypothetical protein
MLTAMLIMPTKVLSDTLLCCVQVIRREEKTHVKVILEGHWYILKKMTTAINDQLLLELSHGVTAVLSKTMWEFMEKLLVMNIG